MGSYYFIYLKCPETVNLQRKEAEKWLREPGVGMGRDCGGHERFLGWWASSKIMSCDGWTTLERYYKPLIALHLKSVHFMVFKLNLSKVVKINHGMQNCKDFSPPCRCSSPGTLICLSSRRQIWAQEGASSSRDFSSLFSFDDRDEGWLLLQP